MYIEVAVCAMLTVALTNRLQAVNNRLTKKSAVKTADLRILSMKKLLVYMLLLRGRIYHIGTVCTRRICKAWCGFILYTEGFISAAAAARYQVLIGGREAGVVCG